MPTSEIAKRFVTTPSKTMNRAVAAKVLSNIVTKRRTSSNSTTSAAHHQIGRARQTMFTSVGDGAGAAGSKPKRTSRSNAPATTHKTVSLYIYFSCQSVYLSTRHCQKSKTYLPLTGLELTTVGYKSEYTTTKPPYIAGRWDDKIII